MMLTSRVDPTAVPSRGAVEGAVPARVEAVETRVMLVLSLNREDRRGGFSGPAARLCQATRDVADPHAQTLYAS